MPARHISSQSFDEILSDLGDDPAIPDPHGIRKPPPHPGNSNRAAHQPKAAALHPHFDEFQLHKQLPKLGVLIVIFGLLIALIGGGFFTYDSLQKSNELALEQFPKQITELKKEMALIRDEIYQDQDDLYAAIDEMEVSIHLLKEKKPEIRSSNKPQAPSFDSELRRWRYLGSSQMGHFYQAYFDTGKGHASFEKGAQVLGEWRLGNIEKDRATFIHPQGKSLVLKASKSE